MSVFVELSIGFAALALASRVSRKLKSFFPPFYILMGILLGPMVFGLVEENIVFSTFADIGLVFLMFYLGYEFSLNQLLRKKKKLMQAGILDFLVNFSLGFLLSYLLDLPLFYRIVFAGIVYMSSSSIITKSLIQLGALKKSEGEMVMGIMIFEDLVMILFLVLIGGIAENQNSLSVLSIGQSVGLSLLFAIVFLYIGRKYHFLLEWIIGHDSHEVSHLGFMALVLASVALGLQFGVKMALSAFLLGLAVSETKSKDDMEPVVLKFRDIFGGIFFFYFGLTFSFGQMDISLWVLGLIVLVAALGKVINGLLLYKVRGCSLQDALFVGIASIPRGEFSILIAALVIETYPFFMDIAIVLILATSFLTSILYWIMNWTCKTFDVCVLSNQLVEQNEGDM